MSLDVEPNLPADDDPGDGGPGGVIGGGGGPPTPTPTPPPPPAVPNPPPPPTSSIVAAIVASSVRGGYSVEVSRIPLVAVPSQVLSVQLGSQSCRIAVYQKRTGLYLDLSVNGLAVAVGMLCRDRVWLVRDGYIGFTGDLAFMDMQGLNDPDYIGLDNRFQLLWGH